ncbi:hypothetical protein SynROS8604_00265 [Synechococcus sp. ROS8604]|nr:hypothetical protein SynROS8604_00265 [Synechococcus sp. ROS8604]
MGYRISQVQSIGARQRRGTAVLQQITSLFEHLEDGDERHDQ